MKLTEAMKTALRLLAQHERVLVSSNPVGRNFGPSTAIHPSTANALEERGLVKIEHLEGRPDRERGLNQSYASITEEGRRVVTAL